MDGSSEVGSGSWIVALNIYCLWEDPINDPALAHH